jgi:hypothetical protein
LEEPNTEDWLHIEALKKQASGDGLPEKLSLLRLIFYTMSAEVIHSPLVAVLKLA